MQYMLGKSYYQIAKYKKAKSLLQRVFTADSSNISAGTYLGLILMKLREYRAADQIHLALLIRDRTNAHIYKQLGISAFHQGNDSTAIANTGKYFSQFEKWSQIPDADVLYYTGRNYLKVGEVRAALFAFQEGAKQFPDNRIFHREVANILYGKQRYEEAVEPLTTLIALGDSSAGVYQRLGFCYYYLENMIRAKEAFRTAFTKDPSNGLTAFYLGITNRETGNSKEAIALFEQAEKLSYPAYLGDLYIQTATAYQQAELFQQAIRAYTQAIEYTSQGRDILFHIATIYDDDLKDIQNAVEYYEKYLNHTGATTSDNENYARERLQKLKEKMFFDDE
mgnify:CR=1 FL=1